tara:strand:+ start:46 stop:585 length:540 start_codon:yes stop_codon:yes gene_type:complete
MNKYKLPYFIKQFNKNKYQRLWTNKIKKTLALPLKQTEIKNKFKGGYGILGEDYVNNFLFNRGSSVKYSRPENELLPMIDFLVDKNGYRFPIEVKSFISNEINIDNKINLLFSKNYYYLPSTIILTEISPERDLINFYEMKGQHWNKYIKKTNIYYSNIEKFKNKVSVNVNLSDFTLLK